MRGSQADIAVTAAVAALACGAAAAGAPSAVTMVLGVALFAMPGYLLAQLLLGPGHGWPGTRTGGRRACVHRAHRRRSGAVHRGSALAPCLLACRARWGDPGLRCGPALAPPDWPGPTLSLATREGRLPPWHVAAFGAAVVIAACGVGLARVGAAIQPQPRFTQLWLSTRGVSAGTIKIGVTNDEGHTTGYRLVLMRNGHVEDCLECHAGKRGYLAADGALQR